MRTMLRENEKVVMTTQRHPVTVLLLYAVAIALLVLSISFSRAKVGQYLIYLCLAAAVISVIRTLAWQRHIWAVTNQRIVDEEGIFTIRSRECPLEKITNVMIAQSVPGRLFGYGKIRIQTAGEQGITEEARMIRPKSFRNAIFEQQEQYRERMMRTRGKAEAEPPSGGADRADMKECPFCAEWIKAKAKICRFCGRELPTES